MSEWGSPCVGVNGWWCKVCGCTGLSAAGVVWCGVKQCVVGLFNFILDCYVSMVAVTDIGT